MVIDLTVTVGSAGGRVRWARDVRVEADADQSAGDVRRRLAAFAGQDPATPAWVDGRCWEDHRSLAELGLRTGSHVLLGGPVAQQAAAGRELWLVGGHGAGRRYRLRPGVSVVGRDARCDAPLPDPSSSRRHLEVRTDADIVSVRDLASTNGSTVGGAALDGVRHLRADDVLRIGDTLLAVGAGDVLAEVRTGAADPPRPVPQKHGRPGQQELQFPVAPASRSVGVPWVAAAVPAGGGVAVAWWLRNPEFLAFVLLSPAVLLGQALVDRLGAGRRRRRERRRHAAECAALEQRARELVHAETVDARAVHPDPVRVLATAVHRRPGLWSRPAGREDALIARLGTTSRPSSVRVCRAGNSVPAGELADVPYAVDLRSGALGIVGPATTTRALAQWVVAQLVTALPPTELRVVPVVDEADPAWRWLRWLPHVQVSPPRLVSPDARDGAVQDLVAGCGSDGREVAALRTVVVLDADVAAASAVSTALRRPGGHLTAVAVADRPDALPAACATVAAAGGATGTRLVVRRANGGEPDRDVLADLVDPSWTERLGRALASVTATAGADAGPLPLTVRLLDLLGLPRPTPEELVRRWSRRPTRLTTPIGTTTEGPLVLDLAELGPHCLVAGTTGAGKSELLQSLVAGLAVGQPPDALGFVLIDYKGGAAFAECAGLPHTVAVATDLDGPLTRRALISLNAEIVTREAELAKCGAPSLEALERSGAAPAPARLVIVVDEFAALASEFPDFLAGLVGIAQRGRSLGVHLVLATQRPAGIVSPEIRANTALRIALRTVDPGESLDVVGDPAASRLSRETPGRAVLRVDGRLVEMQSALVTAPAPVPREAVTITELDGWRRPVLVARPPTGATDLELLVAAAREAARMTGVRPARSPWSPPLPVSSAMRAVTAGTVPNVVVGTLDLPAEQRQADVVLELHRGDGLLLVGGARSGRSSALVAVAATAARACSPDRLHVHALDFAGGELRELAALPHCGTVLGPDDVDSVRPFLERLISDLGRRSGTTPAVLMLIDGWDALAAASDDVDGGRTMEAALAFLQAVGRSGVSAVIAGGRAAMSGRLPRLIEQKFVLRLADPGDLALAGVPPKVAPTRMRAGRAVQWSTGAEMQLGVLDGDPDPRARSAAVAAIATGVTGRRSALVVRALPRRISVGECTDGAAGCARPDRVVLGLGGTGADAVVVDLRPGARLLVAGPDRSGRSTVLRTVLSQLAGLAPCVVVASARSPLTDFAAGRDVPRLAPDAPRGGFVPAAGTTVLVDDLEALLDTALEAWLVDAARRDPAGLSVIGAGRTPELVLTFRGLAAELRRARAGVLLQPSPGDGELLGVRLPAGARPAAIPGRGVAVLAPLLSSGAPPSLREPFAIQVAHP